MRRPGLRLADKCPYSVPLKRDFLLHAGVLLVQIKTPTTVSFLFAIILPDCFQGACYVRKHKLNFRNRELLDERQHFPFRKIEASLSQIWLKPDNSGVSLQAATADGGAIRAEVIDGEKSTQFTKWGRKYLLRKPGGYSFPRFLPSGSRTFSDHPMESLTFQLHLLDIEILQILRPLRSAAHEDKLLIAKTGLPFIRN